MYKKNARLSITQLVSIFLVLVVVIFGLFAIFNPAWFDWVRNLPSYSYNDTDRIINETEFSDQELFGFCTGSLKTGYIRDKNQIYIFVDENRVLNSELTLKGSVENGEIVLKKSFVFDFLKEDLKVAKIENRKISIYPEVLDLDNEFHQNLRFLENKPKQVTDFLKYTVKLDGSYTEFNNQICRVSESESESKIKPAWPGDEVITILNLKLSVKGKELKIGVLEDYFNIDESKIRFFYLIDKKNYIEVLGDKGWLGKSDDVNHLFKIYLDGSIWYDPGKIRKYDVEIGEMILGKPNSYILEGFTESNLRLDNSKDSKWNYDKLKNFLEKI